MALKKMMIITLTCLMLAAALTGCGCQAKKAEPTETAAETKMAVEETEQNRETETGPAETSEAAVTTEPTETVKPAETVKPTQATEPGGTTEPTEDNSWIEEVPKDTRPPIEITLPDETQPYTSYEQYMDMSGEEQEAFFDSFENEKDFFDWFNAAKAEYEKAHPPVIIDGSTNIEIKP